MLVQVKLRCRQHEAAQKSCDACQLLCRAERQYQRLRSERARMVAELRTKLANGELIIIDVA
jgi:uncharacterized protein (DUF3084 family)